MTVYAGIRSPDWYGLVYGGGYLLKCIKCLRRGNIIMGGRRGSMRPKFPNSKDFWKKEKIF
jgi:hypothetical protein